jgi:hypothetical protein
VEVFGSARLEDQSASTGKNTISITISTKQDRKPLHREHSKRIQAALSIGMRALRGPARFGDGFSVKDDDGSFYEPDDSVQQLIMRRERINEVDVAIAARGVGRSIALSLGLELSERANASGEWWLQGLRRAVTKDECRKVQRAVAEWADAESIASHIGYKIDLFCTLDEAARARRAGSTSIFDQANRAWLIAIYGVRIVSISELAEMVTT